jgi:hypothetical protein
MYIHTFCSAEFCLCQITQWNETKCFKHAKGHTRNTKRTALHIAARYGNHKCIRHLVEIGANINQADKDNKTPLDLAIWKHHYLTIRELLRLGAKPSIGNVDYSRLKTLLTGYTCPFNPKTLGGLKCPPP